MELLNVEKSILVLIDVQEKLMPFIRKNKELTKNLKKLILGCQVLNIPIIVTEQYSKGLGSTISELKDLLKIYQPIEKTSFSCFGEEEFRKKLTDLNRNQVLIAGIETHVCVYQTARDLDNNGYYVHLVTDCMSSRAKNNKKLAIQKLSKETNIMSTGVEMVLFELLRDAKNVSFKDISKIVK